MADDEKQWRFVYVWRRPEGYPFSEEEIDERFEGSDDYLVNMNDWGSFVWCPAVERIHAVDYWPQPVRTLLDWLCHVMDDNMSIAVEFDTPKVARALKMPIPTLLAARDALVQLCVIWYFPRALRAPFGEENDSEAWEEYSQIGINFRFQKWTTDRDTVYAIWSEEERKYTRTRSRPLEARKHLQRSAISNDLRWQIYARDKFTCRYCGESGVPLALDHLIPILRGGTNDPENLVTSCQSCNSRKGAQWPEER